MKHIHWCNWEHHRRHRRHGGRIPILVVGHTAYALEFNRRLKLSATNNVGGKPLSLAIAFRDQHGNSMPTAPTPDSPPTWTNTTPADETLTVSTDGLSCQATAVAAGTDEIDLTVIVGGKTFSASLAVTVTPEVPVLTSVEIVPAA